MGEGLLHVFLALDLITKKKHSGVTLYQGAPGSKFSKDPLVDVSKARVERRICTSFLGVQGMLIRNIFESRLSEMPFPGLWGVILQNSDGQKTTL